MSLKKLAMGMAIASTVCLGSKLALASGAAKPIRQCTDAERNTTGPQSTQVFLYSVAQVSSAGTCWVLELPTIFVGDTWGGYDTVGEGFPNDIVQSVRTGSSVRIKLFWNTFFAHDEGATYNQAAGSWYNLGSPWGGNASAARVEWTGHPANCAATTSYLSIWDTAGSPVGGGDCTMLSTISSQGHYYDPVQMAFRNDNLSAFASGASARSFGLWNNTNYGSGSWLTDTSQMSCGNVANLSACGIHNYNSNNADNQVSSIN